MIHEQQQMILMGSDVQKQTQFLIMNTPSLHPQSFCATRTSSSLPTKMT
jgi:hypothetical protein